MEKFKTCPNCNQEIPKDSVICLKCKEILQENKAEKNVDNRVYKEYLLPIKYLLLSWSLIWRSILLPFIGLLLFNIVVIYALSILKIDTKWFISFWDKYDFYIKIPIMLIMFEWAGNVITKKYFNYDNLWFLGWAFFWRFQIIYWILLIVAQFTVLGNASILIIEILSCVCLALWLLPFLNKKKGIFEKFKNQEDASITPDYIFNKAKMYVPGLYFLQIILILISFTVGVGLIILMLMLPRVYPIILAGIGIGVCITIYGIIGAFIKIVLRKSHEVNGIEIKLNENNKFVSMLKELASNTGTAMPKHVIISEDCEFSVQRNKLITLDGKKIKNRILTISAPLLNILTLNEFKGILAHEFAHFSGKDTVFSNKIYPVYLATSEALDSMSEASGWMVIPNLLPMLILSKFVDYFHKINMLISRGREFRSDLIAARIVGKNVFENGLSKVIAYSEKFYEIIVKAESIQNFNYQTTNFYSEFKKWVERENYDYKSACKINEEEDDIYSSHPSFSQRIENIKNEKDGEKTDEPVYSLFDKIDAWERPLTNDIQKRIVLIENRNKARYLIVLSNLKKMRGNKEFNIDLSKLLNKDMQAIENEYYSKSTIKDTAEIKNLKEEQSIYIVNYLNKYIGENSVEIEVKVDADNTEYSDVKQESCITEEEKETLTKKYEKMSDEEIKELAENSRASFTEGVYELVMNEYNKRKINV